MDFNRLLKTRVTNLYPEAWKPFFMRRTGKVWKGPSYSRRSRRWQDLLFLTDHLAALVKMNAPLAAGLQEAVSLDAPNSKIEAIVLTLREDLENGTSLADAMDRRPRFFPRFYVDLVRAGEVTGALHQTLLRAAEELERRLLVRSTWVAFLAYVGTVLLAQFAIFLFLTVKVVPVFAEILADVGSALPAPAQFLSDFSSIVTLHWKGLLWLGIALLLLQGLFLYLLRTRRRLRAWVQGMACRIPIVGPIIIKGELAKAGFILEKLLAGGVPLPEALGKMSRVDLNSVHTRLFARMQRRVEQGQPLREALGGRSRFFPATFRTVLALGETSGMLPEAFADMASLYSRESAKAKSILADILMPLIILAIAAMCGFVCIGLYTSIWSLLDVMIGTL